MTSPSPLAPGYYLDRYELLCPIAEGGMASVWVARLRGKHGFEKFVAVKTILPQFATDNRFQNMFLDEARIASRIEHTNVAHILDLGEQHDILYLVMEWVDGDSLSRLYRAAQKGGAAFPHGVLLRVVADACGGLHAAHELTDARGASLDLVHRDVSPQNILLSPNGVAKLIDFGIAKARGRLGEDTNAGLLKGKIHYMAPEQATGGHVDRRADVFSVGAILYHLLSGKPPFDGANQLAILHRLTSKQPPVPLPSSVHPSIVALVRRALSHSPDARFATAIEMQAAIERAMVEAKIPCTTAEVAGFAMDHMFERALKRKESIDLAVAAATERVRVRELLRPVADHSGAGLPALGSSPGLEPSSPGVASASGVGSAPGLGSSPGQIRPGSSPSMASATLGSSVVDSSIPIDLPPAPGSRKKTLALIAGSLAVGALVAGLAVRAATPAAPKAEVAAGAIRTATAPPPPPTTTAEPPPTTSSISADALPVASKTIAPPKASAAASSTRAPAPTKTTTHKPKIDDGF